MIIDNLYLEVTRNCTIECEHCLRGNRERKNMSLNTLDNIFKEIKEVKHLLLSGGEPLINIETLEEIPILIKKYNLNINTISIITNGTVKTKRHIKALEELKENCNIFNFILSNDLFHKLEWKRLGIEETIDRNFKEYKELFDIKKYPINETYCKVSLTEKGKAVKLTQQRINEITKNKYIHYYFKEIEKDDNLSYEDNRIHGKICIDVNGNIVDYSMSFNEEDEFSSNGLNVNLFPFNEIVKVYINDYKDRNYSFRKKRTS